MKNDLKALRDLEKRLAEAKGPSFALEQEILEHVDWARFEAGVKAPPYTASLDAAVDLVERVLPGFARGTDYNGEFNDGRRYHAFVRGPGFGRMTEAFGPNDALALCLACVRALIAQGEQ